MRQFDGSKFRELVLYIAEQSEGDPRFGAVKLNKILYYSDFEAFRVLGESITGATYRKLSEGPAPLQMLETKESPPRFRCNRFGKSPLFHRYTTPHSCEARAPEGLVSTKRTENS